MDHVIPSIKILHHVMNQSNKDLKISNLNSYLYNHDNYLTQGPQKTKTNLLYSSP